MTAPILIPLLTKASDIGIIVLTRIYIGIPIIAATGIENGLSLPNKQKDLILIPLKTLLY